MNYQKLGTIHAARYARDWRGMRSHPDWLLRSTPGSPHMDTWCMPLRAAVSILDSFKVGAHRLRVAPWNFQKEALLELALVEANKLGEVEQIGNVIIAGLSPSGLIREHVDDGAYSEYFKRIHIVLAAEPGNWFKVNGEAYYPEVGDVFTFDHHAPHSVGNPTGSTRVHLIMDIKYKDD